MERFASFTEQAAILVFGIVAALTFFGVFHATGAPPGGFLSAFFGGIAAVPTAGLLATYSVLSFCCGWFSLLAIPMAVLGTIRRRARWYSVPLAVALLLAGYFGPALGVRVVSWLGGVSAFDGATYWGLSAAIALAAVGQFPIWVRDFWRWTNGAKAAPVLGAPLA